MDKIKKNTETIFNIVEKIKIKLKGKGLSFTPKKEVLLKSPFTVLVIAVVVTLLFWVSTSALQQPTMQNTTQDMATQNTNKEKDEKIPDTPSTSTYSVSAHSTPLLMPKTPSDNIKETKMVSRGAINREEIVQLPNIAIIKTPVPVLKNYSEKTYMDWKKITNTSSPQYQYIKKYMTVSKDGFLRDKYGNIGVALGSYFGKIGTVYEFVLDTGKVINAVKIEEKADEHTVSGYYHKKDHSIIEFVVDTDSPSLKKHMYPNGYIWQGNFDNCPDFNGKISKIYKIEYIEREMLQHENNRDGDNERN